MQKSTFRWFYLLFFLSGFPALIYQIVWQRTLFAIYGVNMESVTVVVSAFMLGLGTRQPGRRPHLAAAGRAAAAAVRRDRVGNRLLRRGLAAPSSTPVARFTAGAPAARDRPALLRPGARPHRPYGRHPAVAGGATGEALAQYGTRRSGSCTSSIPWAPRPPASSRRW